MITQEQIAKAIDTATRQFNTAVKEAQRGYILEHYGSLDAKTAFGIMVADAREKLFGENGIAVNLPNIDSQKMMAAFCGEQQTRINRSDSPPRSKALQHYFLSEFQRAVQQAKLEEDAFKTTTADHPPTLPGNLHSIVTSIPASLADDLARQPLDEITQVRFYQKVSTALAAAKVKFDAALPRLRQEYSEKSTLDAAETTARFDESQARAEQFLFDPKNGVTGRLGRQENPNGIVLLMHENASSRLKHTLRDGMAAQIAQTYLQEFDNALKQESPEYAQRTRMGQGR